jgi:tryptophan-rich hypothetical protein
MKNRYQPKKLLHSKWTAKNPKNKELHFMVVKLNWDEAGEQLIDCDLEAVMTKKIYKIKPIEFVDSQIWLQGWK